MPTIDLSSLTGELVPILLPTLPYLLKGVKLGGEQFAKKIGEIGGEKAWSVIDSIWNKINPKIQETESIKSNLQEIVANIGDEDAVASFRLQLKSILKSDEELAYEIFNILNKPKADVIDISSYIEVGQVAGSLIGFEINRIEALAANIRLHIKIKTINEGGTVIGQKINSIGDLNPSE